MLHVKRLELECNVLLHQDLDLSEKLVYCWIGISTSAVTSLPACTADCSGLEY